MAFVYFAFILLSIVFGALSIHSNNLALVTPHVQQLQMNNDAGQFIAYRDAVTNYMAAHSTFTGTVPASSLNGQFSSAFLASVSNNVSATGTAGRVITCYGNLSAGTVQAVLKATGGDAAVGTSNGTTWTSAATNAVKTPTALNVPVPVGNIVSVIQIGS
jgi:Tfp pilus assembly protein PilV